MKNIFKMRFVRRGVQKLLLISGLLVMFVTFYILNGVEPEEIDRAVKIALIERSIDSPMNQAECKMPDLPVNNPEIMKFYKPADKLSCGDESAWVTCEKSICFVKPEISAKYGDVICSYTDLIRKTDYKVRFGRPVRTTEPYVLQNSDFVKVACTSNDGYKWFGMAYGIRDNVPRRFSPNFTRNLAVLPPELVAQAQREAQDPPMFYNVLIFGFDSMSRNAVVRKLPRTYEYMTKELCTNILKGYNIVGDGTPQAMIPILTGYTELELPETRKRISGAVRVNNYPMIWKKFQRLGYMTSYNEDMPHVGIFTYRMTGFDEQPVDHYLRTYYQEGQQLLSGSNEHCVGNEADHLVMLNYTKNFMLKYRDTPHFIFSFHGGLSHDYINLIGAADDDVHDWLVALKENSLLDNTILVFMADHGNRFAEVRATLQGKQEERLPFFSFTFPDSFKKRFPEEYSNFVANEDRLTTPFDVHATLEHIMQLQTSTVDESILEEINDLGPQTKGLHLSEQARNRAISLLNPIPSNRSCADAYIEPHWCSCLNWQTLKLDDTRYEGIILKLADSIVTTINSASELQRKICAELKLDRINWALRLQPHKEMLQFKSAKDRDGYVPNLNGQTTVNEQIYQLQLVTQPGDALYEASVTYNLQTYEATTKLSDISRVNKYGSQANCIYERDPELRKFCYCRN
ncbi:uncharacterized protein LOC108601853 isoform X2 [Drosophila busckii]|uniref:uncharacterized protein LOC108601853 isoform X2 n=1 Tax=Drosophila busckii TaxID=30019 RepID=UPI00083F0403|nr:uncharacterized protein LOC108601853 isoform X2 [Drosophila busckii]